MSPLELTAVTVTLGAVWLTTRQSLACWPLTLLSVTLYAVVFYEARLYADMGLQGLYFALGVYGWWAWMHGGEDRGALRVSLLAPRARAGLLVVGAVAGAGLGWALASATDASLPYLDSTLTSYSVIAQWLQTRKRLEAWIVWLALDVVYVGLFLFKGLTLTAGLYTLFLWLAWIGLVRWRHTMTGAPGTPAEVPA